jgi:hypothetical protein
MVPFATGEKMLDATMALTPSLFETLVEKGSLGVVIIILLIVIKQLDSRNAEKDAALKAERDARLEDAKAYRDGVIKVNDKVHESVNDIVKVVEFIEKNKR